MSLSLEHPAKFHSEDFGNDVISRSLTIACTNAAHVASLVGLSILRYHKLINAFDRVY